MIGQTISHYKILAKLGEGGMGVVYKAEDTKLKRIVALKFLPSSIMASEAEKTRFIHEAQAAAALNHPNICTIYEINEIDGQAFIAMELVEGQSLKEKIEAGPLKLDETLGIAMQVAEGLQAAHEKKITHRDIKPANIMITTKGQVKIMDFGLAKLAGRSALTKEGATLGTVAYMSPEQARGENVNHRTDIWAFGVVLYEMITGQLPFKAEHDQAVIYSIMNVDPEPMTGLRTGVPMELERIVNQAMAKNSATRYQHADELLVDLKVVGKNIEAGRSTTKAVQPPVRTRKRISKSVLIAAALVLAVTFLAIGYGLFQKEISAPKIVHARALTTTTSVQEVNPKISPDGTKVAYGSDEKGKWNIGVRQIASGQTMNLTKDEKGEIGTHAWSPDGNWIAYAAARDGGGIYVISEYGGATRRVVAHSFEELGRFNWSPDGKKLAYIVKGKLYTVLANGGVPEHIPLPHNARDPAWSPDGERIVLILGPAFSVGSSDGPPFSGIWTIRPDGSDAIAVFARPGHLFSPTWANDGKRIFFKYNPAGTRELWWVPVERNGKPLASARPLTAGLNAYDFSLSSDGSKLAYALGGNNVNIWSLPLGADRMLTMNDALQLTYENQFICNLTMAPDHKWLAFNFDRGDATYDIWLMRKHGQNPRQLIADSSRNMYPSWSPDGSRLAFSSDRTGNMEIYMMPVDGGPATALTADPARDEYPSWSPDGKEIVFHSNRSGNFDLWVTSVSGGGTRQLTNDQADDINPRHSPDGRFISFVSNRKGAWDLYLLPAGGGDPMQLTRVGAQKIMGHTWSPAGKTIYLRYYDPGKDDPKIHLRAVAIADGSMRKILDMGISNYEGSIQSLATDGERLYFSVSRPTGDIWLAELEYE